MAFIKDDTCVSANLKSKVGSRLIRAKILKGGVDLSFKNEKTKENCSVVDKKFKSKFKAFQNL